MVVVPCPYASEFVGTFQVKRVQSLSWAFPILAQFFTEHCLDRGGQR